MRHPDLHQRNIYTRIHEACNVPLVTQPSDPRAFSWTAKLARGLFCPMICSGTIMPQLPDTLTHPPPPYHSNRGNRSHLPFLFYEQLATRRALQRPRRSFLPLPFQRNLNTGRNLSIVVKVDGLFLQMHAIRSLVSFPPKGFDSREQLGGGGGV